MSSVLRYYDRLHISLSSARSYENLKTECQLCPQDGGVGWGRNEWNGYRAVGEDGEQGGKPTWKLEMFPSWKSPITSLPPSPSRFTTAAYPAIFI